MPPWTAGWKPAPLILCESRSLAGVLKATADRYACQIGSTNGQAKGFLVNDVAPVQEVGQRVLYMGDWDHCGHQIEAATRDTISEHAGMIGTLLRLSGIRNPDARTVRLRHLNGLWERVALTDAQVDLVNAERAEAGLPDATILKVENRYKPAQTFPAIETEAFGQRRITPRVRERPRSARASARPDDCGDRRDGRGVAADEGPMTDRPALFCAHANADGDASPCACSLGPDASRERILTYERENR